MSKANVDPHLPRYRRHLALKDSRQTALKITPECPSHWKCGQLRPPFTTAQESAIPNSSRAMTGHPPKPTNSIKQDLRNNFKLGASRTNPTPFARTGPKYIEEFGINRVFARLELVEFV